MAWSFMGQQDRTPVRSGPLMSGLSAQQLARLRAGQFDELGGGYGDASPQAAAPNQSNGLPASIFRGYSTPATAGIASGQQQAYSSANNVADSINQAFQGTGEGGGTIRGSNSAASKQPQNPWFAAPQAPAGPDGDPYKMSDGASQLAQLQYMSQYQMPLGNFLNMDSWNRGHQASTDIANQVNRGFDQYQYYANEAADRHLKGQIVDRLLDGLGGLGGGGGSGMRGFVDMNSGQAASLPGQTTNAITASALSPQQIAGAAQQARSTGPVSGKGSQPLGGAASEVSDIASSAARTRGAVNSNNLERGALQENAGLARGVELAKSRQGIGNASWLAGINQDDAEFDVAMRAPIIRMLMQSLGGALT